MNNGPFSHDHSEGKALPRERGRQIKKMSKADAIIIFSIACGAAFLTAIIQTCFFFNLRPFGFAPDLCLALTVACGVKFGPKFGGIVGLCAGFFLSAFSSPGLSFAAIFYTLVGIAMGILASPESASKLSPLPLFLAGVACGAAITGLGDLIRICVVHSAAPIAIYIFKILFPEAFCTLVFSPIAFAITAITARHLRKRQGLSSK